MRPSLLAIFVSVVLASCASMDTDWSGSMNGTPSDEFRITPKVAEKLRETLTTVGKNKWSNVYVEIQSDGQYLHASVELDHDVGQKDLDDYKGSILLAVTDLIPPTIAGEPTWSVGLNRKGELVDVIDALNQVYGHWR